MLTVKQQEGLLRHIGHYDEKGITTLQKFIKKSLKGNEYDGPILTKFFESPNADDYWELDSAQREMVMGIIIGHIKKYKPQKQTK